jgi:hypothetical protein
LRAEWSTPIDTPRRCTWVISTGRAATAANRLTIRFEDPHAIVSFMTDGIVSMRELKHMPRVKGKGEKLNLGDWEMQRYNGGFFFMSGL